ncbi:MAG: YhfC family glutamic-type intramembrane protease, partial [Ruthenibacterium sp.]
MTDAMVSLPTLLSMGTSALIAIGLPFVLLFVWRKKTGAKYTAALVGAVIFPVFALILEAAFHQLFLGQMGSVSQFLLSNPIAYILYGGLMAGIFEETGRLIGFGWLLRKQSGKECGVMYGIGHGGIETILLAGMSMVSNIVFCLNVNAQGAEAYLMALPPEQMQTMAGALQGILSANPALFLVSGIERIFAIVLHISLSVLVFTAVKRHRLWLYPAAIGLHACVDFI